MTSIKTIATAALFATTAIAAASTSASAGGNYYGAPYYGSAHTHIILGPAGTAQDWNYYARKDCRWLKHRAEETGYRKHWRAYNRCLSDSGY
jgi:hypothetical protein